MGVDDLHAGEAGRDPAGDQVQRRNGVLDRRADRPGAMVPGDQRGARGVPGDDHDL